MALQLAQLYLTSDAETTWKQQSTISCTLQKQNVTYDIAKNDSLSRYYL